MDSERPDGDEAAANIDDLEVPEPDAEAVTGGVLILGHEDQDDPLPQKSCA
ncbi:MAG TPA: hypothetical protein VM942_04195 [Acidimicrobiales bacterium]|nr:hypothetical protein [Acidimicrobiales bacterium]